MSERQTKMEKEIEEMRGSVVQVKETSDQWIWTLEKEKAEIEIKYVMMCDWVKELENMVQTVE